MYFSACTLSPTDSAAQWVESWGFVFYFHAELCIKKCAAAVVL